MGVAVCGSCRGCQCSDFFAGVFITVVVRTPVGIDFGFGPEVVGVRGCNRGRCYRCVVVLLWPFCGCFGPFGACGRCGPVGCLGPSRGCSRGDPCDCFGPLEVIARLGSIRFGHCGGLMFVAGMFVVML